jgi:hypothetical protein
MRDSTTMEVVEDSAQLGKHGIEMMLRNCRRGRDEVLTLNVFKSQIPLVGEERLAKTLQARQIGVDDSREHIHFCQPMFRGYVGMFSIKDLDGMVLSVQKVLG